MNRNEMPGLDVSFKPVRAPVFPESRYRVWHAFLLAKEGHLIRFCESIGVGPETSVTNEGHQVTHQLMEDASQTWNQPLLGCGTLNP